MKEVRRSGKVRRIDQIENENMKNTRDIALIGCEMNQSVRKLEKEIKELSALTCELLEPGYYRRNKYPHTWRLARSCNMRN